MQQLMSTPAVLQALASEDGRAKLATYATDHRGHAHLTTLMDTTRNTFVRMLLAQTLMRGAEVAASDASLLMLDNIDETRRKLPLITPRPPLTVLRESDFIPFLEDLLRKHGVKVRDIEYSIDMITDFYSDVLSPLSSTTTTTSMSYILSLWDSFEDMAGSDKLVARRTNAARADLLSYLFSTDSVRPFFIQHALYNTDHDWDSFFTSSAAVPGTLARMGMLTPISSAAWAALVTEATDSFAATLVVAAAHPSIPEREQALSTVEAQIPFLMDKDAFYQIASVAALLPDKLRANLLHSITDQIALSWHESEVKNWLHYGEQWGLKPSKAENKLVPAGKPKRRWWQA